MCRCVIIPSRVPVSLCGVPRFILFPARSRVAVGLRLAGKEGELYCLRIDQDRD